MNNEEQKQQETIILELDDRIEFGAVVVDNAIPWPWDWTIKCAPAPSIMLPAAAFHSSRSLIAVVTNLHPPSNFKFNFEMIHTKFAGGESGESSELLHTAQCPSCNSKFY
jgi:hypothetical protein